MIEVDGLEGKPSVAAEAEETEAVLVPQANYEEEAQAIAVRQGQSVRVRVMPVGDMEGVLRLAFLQSVRDDTGPHPGEGLCHSRPSWLCCELLAQCPLPPCCGFCVRSATASTAGA